jgi:hypothetical protein
MQTALGVEPRCELCIPSCRAQSTSVRSPRLGTWSLRASRFWLAPAERFRLRGGRRRECRGYRRTPLIAFAVSTRTWTTHA